MRSSPTAIIGDIVSSLFGGSAGRENYSDFGYEKR